MTKYRTVSLRKELVDDIEEHIEESGHYPSISSFVHEAVRLHLQKGIQRETVENQHSPTIHYLLDEYQKELIHFRELVKHNDSKMRMLRSQNRALMRENKELLALTLALQHQKRKLFSSKGVAQYVKEENKL